jgi:hypothetical protein
MEISEVKVRNEFFVSALFVESAMNDYLSQRLNITNPIHSEFLGNREKSLSFDQKVDALLDSASFSIIDKSKLSVFREIYREFLQNRNATSLEESFTSPDSNDDFLMILYPQSEYLPREEKLINACYQLIAEVSELIAEKTSGVEVVMPGRKKLLAADLFKFGKFASLLSFLFVI